ncbi:polyprenyl synthetase family protein [Streptomyces sp. ET3-23]|uniref:polyprenyl synthetase family protein n=1 Tax=Streptomyces sp. ET3-23 TaxID=2885643 RepID=UPI001D0FAED9|nr:polyprenyl synthetase family protein [Streptomyces sp. ET3-23]MCC2280752.1 polyprenyl synthetase family protein [Streptomyces sp. ET3-23]
MTSTVGLATSGMDLSGIRRAVDGCLDDFLIHTATTAADHQMPSEATQILRTFLFAGGKRLRPTLCAIGWHTAHGTAEADGGMSLGPTPVPVIQAATSLEMFHAFCLIHDDLMDHSATRRGRPTVHRALTSHHIGRGREIAEQLGASGAILVGDLALAWSDELLHTAGLTAGQLMTVLPLIDAMRTEVMYGQYLDLLATGIPSDDLGIPLQVIRHKTAKYTVERPLQIGAALAGAGRALLDVLSAYALPLGEAFQLRDDLLGVFGSPEVTGKSGLDDLRDGKHTVLLALGLQRADALQRQALRTLVGDPALDEDGADRIRSILTATGAVQGVEDMITNRRTQAHQALDRAPFPPAATAVLRQLAHTATARTS